jgi:hypothetical protein
MISSFPRDASIEPAYRIVDRRDAENAEKRIGTADNADLADSDRINSSSAQSA